MKILFASAEVYPLAKVGGLGDVAGSLPAALRDLGHDVRIVMPRYGSVTATGKDLGTFAVGIGGADHEAKLRATKLDGVPVYLVDFSPLFDRPKVYEYPDDGQRFAFFAKAVLDLLPAAKFWPDVIHCNDWHTALAPAFLQSLAGDDPYRRIRSVLTIHNLQHQGLFGRDLFEWTGLPLDMWNPEGVEFYGGFNFLKAGIVYADRVNTVSPTYAKEIQTPEQGYGLDGLLRSRSAKLSGILNGIDYGVWNPAKDPHISQKYSKSTLEKKAKNKAALQKEAGLPAEATIPLLGIVSRVTEQKGFDILIPAIPDLLNLGVQIVLLGTGEKVYEEPLAHFASARKGFVAYLKYDESLAHRIYSGSDFFLMPSKFEPCGLGQEISLRYGTIPIVRATGGLADTVVDIESDPKAANGFRFSAYSPAAIVQAVARATAFYRQRGPWNSLRRLAMSQDLSWSRSGVEYVELYRRATAGGPV